MWLKSDLQTISNDEKKIFGLNCTDSLWQRIDIVQKERKKINDSVWHFDRANIRTMLWKKSANEVTLVRKTSFHIARVLESQHNYPPHTMLIQPSMYFIK